MIRSAVVHSKYLYKSNKTISILFEWLLLVHSIAAHQARNTLIFGFLILCWTHNGAVYSVATSFHIFPIRMKNRLNDCGTTITIDCN